MKKSYKAFLAIAMATAMMSGNIVTWATTTNNNSTQQGSTTTQQGSTTQQTTTTEPEVVLSKDNSLRSLTLSEGTLSPTFQGNVTSYTASVGEAVTSIDVDAVLSNNNATLDSITGNTDLQMGENTIRIQVTSEADTVAVYTIVVTRGGTAAEEPEDETEPETTASDEGTQTEAEDGQIVLNGVTYEVSEDFSDSDIPEGFSESTTTYQGSEIDAMKFDAADVTLLYLVSTEDESDTELGVYDAETNVVYQYMRLGNEENYIIFLPVPSTVTAPENYTEATLTIADLGSVPAYQYNADAQMFLAYAVNQSGTMNWYRYDESEGTYQRFIDLQVAGTDEETTIDTAYLQDEYNTLLEQHNSLRFYGKIIIGVFIIIIIILIFAMVNMSLKHRLEEDDDDEEEFDEEFEDEEPEEEQFSKRKQRKMKKERKKREKRFDIFGDDDEWEEEDEPQIERVTTREPSFKQKPVEKEVHQTRPMPKVEDDWDWDDELEEVPSKQEPAAKQKDSSGDDIEILDLNDL